MASARPAPLVQRQFAGHSVRPLPAFRRSERHRNPACTHRMGLATRRPLIARRRVARLLRTHRPLLRGDRLPRAGRGIRGCAGVQAVLQQRARGSAGSLAHAASARRPGGVRSLRSLVAQHVLQEAFLPGDPRRADRGRATRRRGLDLPLVRARVCRCRGCRPPSRPGDRFRRRGALDGVRRAR